MTSILSDYILESGLIDQFLNLMISHIMAFIVYMEE